VTIEERILTELLPDMRKVVAASTDTEPVKPWVLSRLLTFGFDLASTVAHWPSREQHRAVLAAVAAIDHFQWWGRNMLTAAELLAYLDAVETTMQDRLLQPTAA
jgi:hypothetical protein